MGVDWAEQLEAEWQSALMDVGGDTSATIWPNYHLTRARLEITIDRLRADLKDVAHPDLFPEVDLTADNGLVRGRADLVIRGTRHEVIDFKTGAAFVTREAIIRASYARQLAIYSYLEAETSGTWPSDARIVSLTGIDASIDVEPRRCEAEAARAADELEQYNARVPGEQPAYPSSEACGFCPYAARCPAFWQNANTVESVASVSGTISAIQRSEIGGAVVTIDVEGGSVEGPQARLHGVLPSENPLLYGVEPGDRAWIAGLWHDATRNAYRLSGSASVEVVGR